MKLPWDRNYIKISFHVVVTTLVLGAAIMVMARLPQVVNVLGVFLKGFLSLAAPLIIAIVAAFLLDPIVEWFDRRLSTGKKICGFRTRTKGTALTYITLVLLIALGVALAIKKLGATDVNQFALAVNFYIQDLSDMLLSVQKALSHMGILGMLNSIINSVIIEFTQMAKSAVIAVANSITSVGGIALNVAIGFVVAFYFLAEKERILHKMRQIVEVFLPTSVSREVCSFFHDVNMVFSGYVTGQVTDAMIMATLIIISFWAAGIKYAVIIGIISGFSNLIPYIGAVVAFVLSVMVGLISGTPIKALYAAIIVIILQQVDSMIIVPKILGKSVKLHPVLVILALSFFGGLFGIWGMVVAVPIAALLKTYFDRALEAMEIKKLEK